MSIASAFNRAAGDYDRLRRALVPCFDDFYAAAIDAIPFERDAPIRVLDLGAGTGLLSAFVVSSFPRARVTLVDVAGEMLAKARVRFGDEGERVETRVLDYVTEPIPGRYELVISALSIHHVNDADKRSLFVKIFEALELGGAFVNAEQVLGPTPALVAKYRAHWLAEARAKGASEAEIAAAEERMTHDRCATLEAQLAWLREAGFHDIDCWYKSYQFAVYAGRKPA